MSLRLSAAAAVAVFSLVVAAGCGGSNDSGTTTESQQQTTSAATETTTTTSGTGVSDEGKQIFADNCAACHQLAAADAGGVTGPNLDERKPDADEVVAKVNNGGGGMPSFQGRLSDAQIQALADFVSSNAGK